MIIPDTNVFIAYFKGDQSVVRIIHHALKQRQILLSVVSVGEFLVKATKAEVIIIDQMIASCGIVSIDRTIMDQAVILRRRLFRKTKRILFLDCFIAATAKIHKATLLTLDRHDYPFSDIAVKQPEELKLSLKK